MLTTTPADAAEHLALLREKRDALLRRASSLQNASKSILGRADAEGRDLNPLESARIDKNTAEFDSLDREASRISDEILAAERELQASTPPRPRQTAPNPVAGPLGGGLPTRHAAIGDARSFSNLFGAGVADPYRGQFASLGEFALAVAAGNDSRLIRNVGMTTGPGVDGGFAVPLEFLGPVLDAALSREVVRPRASVVPMHSKSVAASTFDYLDGTSGKRGGLQLMWSAEAAALTEQKGKLREVNLTAHKGSILVRVSNELADDAPAFDLQLSRAMVAAVAAGLDAAFISGTGVAQPLGILNAASLITVDKESGQGANTIQLQNLAKMIGRLAPSSYADAVWLVHPTAVPQLYLMSYTTTNVAGSEIVSGTAAQAITQGPNGDLRIFGRPVVVTEACSTLSSAGDVILADFSRYLVGLRADAMIQRDSSAYFASDEIGFRLVLRCDGLPMDNTPMKLRDGTNTVSPFIALGAR